MEPDEFLDWLEEKRASFEQRIDAGDHMAADVVQELIDDFNLEFDTRDSPLDPVPQGERKKKEKS